jgi:hypothetical protein
MKTNPSKLAHRHKTEAVEEQTELMRPAGREFNSAEELLRLDAEQTPVPPAVEVRLAESIQQEPQEPAETVPWWKRMFC